MWEASEGRRRRGPDPSRASVSGVREEDEAGSAGGGSRASVGAAAPQRWRPNRGGVAAPTRRPLRARGRPTSQYRASPLAPPRVTRAEAGPMGGGGRTEGAGLLLFFFLSNKMSRREGGERPASGDAAARARARAPGGGRAVGWAPRPVRLCAGPGPPRAGPGAGWAAGQLLLLLAGSQSALSATSDADSGPGAGGHGVGSNDSLKDSRNSDEH